MDHSLSVVVQIDLEARCVHLVVTGCLTERNHRTLTPLVARARTLLPGTTVTVDLTGAQRVDPGGLDLLQWSVDHDPVAAGSVQVLTRPVLFGLPEPARPAAARPAGPASWNVGGVAA